MHQNPQAPLLRLPSPPRSRLTPPCRIVLPAPALLRPVGSYASPLPPYSAAVGSSSPLPPYSAAVGSSSPLPLSSTTIGSSSRSALLRRIADWIGQARRRKPPLQWDPVVDWI
ncbi:hypothetical protein [Paenibacillus tyrfis]|uniref:hypothetical protein n=1 Tax=Paenibacillus tyrfis TaxID=1501230 RepID=UPI002491D972|nr:hypothetical protein [Paenibacillus tyrfis]